MSISAEDRLPELIERITLAAHGPVDPKIEQTWTDTAMRRLAEIESGKAKLVRGAEAMARARRIVGR